jgi:hypothetical protein
MHINTSGLREMIKALDDLIKFGIPRAMAELDDALDRTGRDQLRTRPRPRGHPQGQPIPFQLSRGPRVDRAITYGGRGAAFEMAKGGEHASYIDSLAGLSHDDFLAAMDSAFRDL